MKTKILIIVPYYGSFNDYFSLWLKSCGNNYEIEWLLITDIVFNETVPTNVHIVRKNFDQLRSEFEQKLRMKISLDYPYKLCDFRGSFGFLFQEYLQDYDFWGYCDCDVIFGKISDFLNDHIFDRYDKILRKGHLSFVRNTKEINENFMRFDTYKISLTNSTLYAYDESIDGYHLGFAGELMNKGFSFYQNDKIVADIDFRHFPFYVVSSPEKSCMFTYKDGKIYRIDRNGKSFDKCEMLYLHLQKRKMIFHDQSDSTDYLIYPNEIVPYDEMLLSSNSFWNMITSEKKDYFDFKKEKWSSFQRDLQRLLHEPKKLDSILYRLNFRKK